MFLFEVVLLYTLLVLCIWGAFIAVFLPDETYGGYTCRSNLAPVILQLKALGIDNVLRFNFLTPPPVEMMIRSLEVSSGKGDDMLAYNSLAHQFLRIQLLYSLNALDNVGRLTIPLGVQLAEFPVDPLLGKVVS
jgi:ATP-dependent RNA helicase DDX35